MFIKQSSNLNAHRAEQSSTLNVHKAEQSSTCSTTPLAGFSPLTFPQSPAHFSACPRWKGMEGDLLLPNWLLVKTHWTLCFTDLFPLNALFYRPISPGTHRESVGNSVWFFFLFKDFHNSKIVQSIKLLPSTKWYTAVLVSMNSKETKKNFSEHPV
jgi:hypothetical protein